MDVEDIAKLLDAGGWQVIALLVALAFGWPIWRVVWGFGSRLAQAEEVAIGSEGIRIKGRLDEVSLRLAAMETREQNIRDALLGTVAAGTGDSAQALPQLIELADQYRDLRADYAERVAMRTKLADQMAILIIANNLDRRPLAASGHEGQFVAVASAIILAPLEGDMNLIASMSVSAKFNFTRYRLVLALGVLMARRIIRRAHASTVRDILRRLRGSQADASLLEVIEQAEAVVSQLT